MLIASSTQRAVKFRERLGKVPVSKMSVTHLEGDVFRSGCTAMHCFLHRESFAPTPKKLSSDLI